MANSVMLWYWCVRMYVCMSIKFAVLRGQMHLFSAKLILSNENRVFSPCLVHLCEKTQEISNMHAHCTAIEKSVWAF